MRIKRTSSFLANAKMSAFDHVDINSPPLRCYLYYKLMLFIVNKVMLRTNHLRFRLRRPHRLRLHHHHPHGGHHACRAIHLFPRHFHPSCKQDTRTQ
jgi:hypothetical protein